jgi:hypothetical protein
LRTLHITIHRTIIPSSQHCFEMSFSTSDSSSNLPPGRKRTVSQRITENGDPLVVKKKAREALKQQTSTSAIPATEPAALAIVTKKVPQV